MHIFSLPMDIWKKSGEGKSKITQKEKAKNGQFQIADPSSETEMVNFIHLLG